MAREMTDKQIEDVQRAWDKVQQVCDNFEDYEPRILVLGVYTGADEEARQRNQQAIRATLIQLLAGIYNKAE